MKQSLNKSSPRFRPNFILHPSSFILSLMMGVMILIFAFTSANALTLTQAEYFIDTDPGHGNGTAISITADDSVIVSNLRVATTSLSTGIHRFFLRYRSDSTGWSHASGRYFFIISPDNSNYQVRNVVEAEYWFDNGTHTVADLTDGPTANFIALLPTTGLTAGIHTFNITYRSSASQVSAKSARYFFIISPDNSGYQVRMVSHLEYWFDSNPGTVVDVTDGLTVSFSQMFAASGLGIGQHTFNIRYRDDSGLWGAVDARRVTVLTLINPPGPPSRLTAGEYYINVDPGNGNGVPFTVPQDGAWDEQNEDVLAVITGIPTGNHRFCLRFKDEANNWSSTVCDTLIVGPVLVIRAIPGTNDIILDWQSDLSGAPFHVYRANSTAGVYNEIGTTNDLTYTDIGISATQTMQFYQVRFTETGALSTFRLPLAPRSEQKTE